MDFDNARIETLYKQLRGKLHRWISNQIHDEALADDLVQETFIRIHAGMGAVRNESGIYAWIYQIARNVIADHFRRQNRQQLQFLPEDDDAMPEEMTTAMADMLQMMNKMPVLYCEALCLTEIQGMSQKEYAGKAGISYSAARTRVQRARIMLRDMLMHCCHYQFDKYGTVTDIFPKACCCCKSGN